MPTDDEIRRDAEIQAEILGLPVDEVERDLRRAEQIAEAFWRQYGDEPRVRDRLRGRVGANLVLQVVHFTVGMMAEFAADDRRREREEAAGRSDGEGHA